MVVRVVVGGSISECPAVCSDHVHEMEVHEKEVHADGDCVSLC